MFNAKDRKIIFRQTFSIILPSIKVMGQNKPEKGVKQV